jgi:stage V sporulation protein S
MRTDLRDVATSSSPSLKVGAESKPQSVARAIQHVMRESPTKLPPAVNAIGPAAINQAVKAIAIAQRQVGGDGLTVRPVFESANLREGSNVALVLDKAAFSTGADAVVDDALSVKPSTDAFKLAGAIAGRMRDGQKATILVKGAVPVLIAVKAIAKAQEYLAQEKDKLSSSTLAFTAALVDRENKDLRNAPTSTFTQLSIVGVPTAAAA